jgi:hypothetical protein
VLCEDVCLALLSRDAELAQLALARLGHHRGARTHSYVSEVAPIQAFQAELEMHEYTAYQIYKAKAKLPKASAAANNVLQTPNNSLAIPDLASVLDKAELGSERALEELLAAHAQGPEETRDNRLIIVDAFNVERALNKLARVLLFWDARALEPRVRYHSPCWAPLQLILSIFRRTFYFLITLSEHTRACTYIHSHMLPAFCLRASTYAYTCPAILVTFAFWLHPSQCFSSTTLRWNARSARTPL